MDFIYIEYDDLLIGRKDLDIYNFYGTEPGGAWWRESIIAASHAARTGIGLEQRG